MVPDNMVIGLDPDKGISKGLYNVHKLPESFIFSPERQLKERIIGVHDNWVEHNQL